MQNWMMVGEYNSRSEFSQTASHSDFAKNTSKKRVNVWMSYGIPR
jgi:hypothetical protein